MSKVITVSLPEVTFDSATAEYVLKLDLEEGQEPRVFRAVTMESLAQKLGYSEMHATRRIAELTESFDDLEGRYRLLKDVCDMLTALLLIKHSSNDEAPKALDRMIRSLAKEIKGKIES